MHDRPFAPAPVPSTPVEATERAAARALCPWCRTDPCRTAGHRRRSTTPTVTVVVAARDEAANVAWVTERMPPVDEIVLVDGGSVDGTVTAWQAALPATRVLTQTHPGKGAAVAAGLAAATGDVVVMLDADGSMDPAEIPLYVAALVAGADVVKGSRAAAGGGSDDLSPLRRAGNAGLRLLANGLYRQRWSELAYGYAAFWADVLDDVAVADLVAGTDPRDLGPVRGAVLTAAQTGRRPLRYGAGFEIEAVLFCRAAAAGLRVAEVPSFEYDRRHGTSHLDTWRDGLRVLTATMTEHRHRRRVARRRAPHR